MQQKIAISQSFYKFTEKSIYLYIWAMTTYVVIFEKYTFRANFSMKFAMKIQINRRNIPQKFGGENKCISMSALIRVKDYNFEKVFFS